MVPLDKTLSRLHTGQPQPVLYVDSLSELYPTVGITLSFSTESLAEIETIILKDKEFSFVKDRLENSLLETMICKTASKFSNNPSGQAFSGFHAVQSQRSQTSTKIDRDVPPTKSLDGVGVIICWSRAI